MKLSFLLLILVSFIQTVLIPLNLVLILLVTQTFFTSSKANYHVALIIGILVGVLSSTNIGFYPILFISCVFLVNLSKHLPFSSGIKIFIPVMFISLILSYGFEIFVLRQTETVQKVALETLISIPVYMVMRLWGERPSIRDGRLRI